MKLEFSAVEHGADGSAAMDALNCFTQHGGDRHYAGLRVHLGSGDWQGVGYDEFLDVALFDYVACFACENWVSGVAVDVFCAVDAECIGSGDDSAACADFVVHDDGCFVSHIADECCSLDAFLVADADFFHDCERGVQPICHVARAFSVAGIGCDDYDVVVNFSAFEVLGEAGYGAEFVEWDVEEALYLSCVQFEGEDAVCAGSFDEVGDESGGDGNAGLIFFVAAGVCEVGDDCGNSSCGCALGGVNHYQEFHDVVVDGECDGLD